MSGNILCEDLTFDPGLGFRSLLTDDHWLNPLCCTAGLAVDAGFRFVPEPDATPRAEGDFRPAPGWNGKFKDVWTFEYRRCDSRSHSLMLYLRPA